MNDLCCSLEKNGKEEAEEEHKSDKDIYPVQLNHHPKLLGRRSVSTDEGKMNGTKTLKPSRIPVRSPSNPRHRTCLMPTCMNQQDFFRKSRRMSENIVEMNGKRNGTECISRTLHSSIQSKHSSTSVSTSDSDSRQSSQSRLSRYSLTFEGISDIRVNSPLHMNAEMHRMSVSDYDQPHPSYSLTLSLTTLSEHLVIATVQKKSWLAGWSRFVEKRMPNTLHVGDQIIEVNGEEMQDGIIHHIYSSTPPGTPITIRLRKQPNAITFSLVKPINPSKWNLGIVLHNHKNRIECIEEDSIAYRRGVPSEMTSYKDPSTLVSSVITDINGNRLQMWARDDQFFRILDTIRDGSEFSISIQPYDFIKSLKFAMKMQKKLYKAFS